MYLSAVSPPTSVWVGRSILSTRSVIQLFTAFVASTAFHAQELGFRTILIDDCSRGINEQNILAAYEKLGSWWGLVVQVTSC